jgi:CheY-like chemotaxis protein
MTESSPPSLPPLHILVAEDNPISQKVAMALLARHGHQVTVVGDGRAAVAAVAEGSFDAVLMDIQMPDMDGLEATRAIRGLGGKKGKLPIIAMTAGEADQDQDQCRAAGMDGHITKPFDPARIFPVLQRCLADRQA